MIIVNCALRQDDIIGIVENIVVEDKKAFKFVKKEGLKLFFDCTLADGEKAAALVKQTIKGTDLGKALFFSVNAQ